MKKLKKSIADSLISHTPIYAYIADRVYRKRNDKHSQMPCIVYDISWYDNRLWPYQWTHGYQWNKVVLDIIGEYMYEDQLDEIAEHIVSYRWWFIGQLTSDRSGTIAFEGRDDGYDPKTDYSIVRLFFLFKHTY